MRERGAAKMRSLVQGLIGVPFVLVSVGPERDETIELHDPFA